MMKPTGSREWSIFLTAVQFFSRFPLRHIPDYDAQMLAQSRGYFPLVGWLIAAVTGVTLWLAQLVFPVSVAVWLSLIAGVLATGAFHEDGFADCCDGFGGGWSAEQVLTIMKDSRVGSYATIGMILLLATLATTISAVVSLSLPIALWVLWQSHAISRYLASIIVDFLPYVQNVQDTNQSKAKPIASQPLSRARQGVGFAAAMMPVCLSGYWQSWVAAGIAAAVVFAFARYSQHRIGGYTGDVLGAAQQLATLSFWLGFLALM